jgi:hypothetical protein
MKIRSKLVFGIGGVSLAMLAAMGAILMALINHYAETPASNVELEKTLDATVSVGAGRHRQFQPDYLRGRAEKGGTSAPTTRQGRRGRTPARRT